MRPNSPLKRNHKAIAREFQSLLLRNLDIAIEGFHISRLILNRHTPQVDQVSLHRHSRFHQCLVYLKGRGHQIFPDREIPVRRGSVIFIPRHMKHGFRKERALRPLCLGIEFESEAAEGEWEINSRLNPASLKRLEQGLVQLGQLQDSGADSLSIAGTILDLLGILRETATGGGIPNFEVSGPLASRAVTEIQKAGLDSVTTAELTKRLGFRQTEELNRNLRNEGSPTIARILTSRKLAEVTAKLQESSASIGEIAEQVGFLDQNYFARWFKTQTGKTPTEYRQS